jgi:hypothetical protein
MNTGIFTLNLASFKSALVSTVLMAILAMLVYIIGLGDVWQIDLKALTNIGILALATGLVSLIKNFLTSNDGNFAGLTKIE